MIPISSCRFVDAYLMDRFVLAEPHPQVPKAVRFSEGFSDFQVARASGFASAFLDYKVDYEHSSPGYVGS